MLGDVVTDPRCEITILHWGTEGEKCWMGEEADRTQKEATRLCQIESSAERSRMNVVRQMRNKRRHCDLVCVKMFGGVMMGEPEIRPMWVALRSQKTNGEEHKPIR